MIISGSALRRLDAGCLDHEDRRAPRCARAVLDASRHGDAVMRIADHRFLSVEIDQQLAFEYEEELVGVVPYL